MAETEKAHDFLDQMGLGKFKTNEQVVLAMESNSIFAANDLAGLSVADLREAGFPAIPAKQILQAAGSMAAGSMAAEPLPAALSSAPAAGSLAKAEAALSKAEDSLVKFGFGLDVADGVLSALSVVPIPGLSQLCDKLRSAIGAARGVQDLAEDALLPLR
jgi:hypothetical protein